MENTIGIGVKSYHLVLQKFINLTLFGKVAKPKFTRNICEFEIQKSLTDFFDLLQNQSEEVNYEYINSYYKNTIAHFRKKIRKEDLVNIMNCYGFSNLRILNNILRLFDTGDKLKNVDIHRQDGEILNELIWSTEFPDEIKDYLQVHFFDFLKFIPYKSRIITKEQYQFFVDRYVVQYDYNKVLNIVYQNFDDID
ncbi:hypothetical protein LPB90_03255 [Chryseobacterium sp. LC2016-29]|uniref:hypothetical protein n=1 Tax=Chryseobacterium sp. LC2016-29 TaxID=2897331 RepID=UPI001E5F7467|nr:hypothetical protein [Chryseobacterium sp. LC2016-29]MCD0477459.1 hypothetical protein [Chryseobacterium sp. LC2016-29]